MMAIFSAPRVIAGGRLLDPGAVAVEDGRVVEVLDRRPPAGPGHLALERGVLAPGLIDLQLNGAFGVDLVDADAGGWERVLCGLPSTGVTALLATFISAPVDDLAAAMRRAGAARAAAGRPGSRLLGVHLEGPFLSERRRGAHDAGQLVDPTPELVDRLMEAGAGILELLTLAPEREGAIEATKRLAGAGVLVSVGHSDALAEQVAAAAEAGARMVTHVFNAQGGLHHREPVVAGQALADARLACGLIADLYHVDRAICRVVMEAARGRLVTFLARGSSDNAATYGRYLCEIRAGRPASLAAPSVATLYRARMDLRGVLAVALSQSGETAEIVETLRWAREHGARTIAVTNGATSALAEVADLALATRAGPELAVPATKTYTAELTALTELTAALGPDDPAFDAAQDRVPAAIESMLSSAPMAESLAGELAGMASLVVSGRGFTYSTALELALKVKETCLLPAIGISHADLEHGPIAVLRGDTPALLVAPPGGPVLPGITALAGLVAERGSRAYGIGGDRAFAAACTAVLPGPDLPEPLAPLALVVPGQLLVEALARRLGLDPDRPRGLTKVTQTGGASA